MKISPVYDHISGNIKHLRNDFKAVINRHNISDLIKELHPTPAVCGVPKEQCSEIIKNNEKYNRAFYAGYIQTEQDNEITCFVNLRCAQLFRNGILLYAGGGITALSEPEKEWKETEMKADAVLQRLTFLVLRRLQKSRINTTIIPTTAAAMENQNLSFSSLKAPKFH